MIRVTHVITDLEVGGAELALARLAPRLEPRSFEVEVISLKEPGPVAERLARGGVPVSSLRMTRPVVGPGQLRRLIARLRQVDPDVVQTWMYHADLLGGVAARLAHVPSVAWGVRQTDLRPGAIKRTTRTIAWLNTRLAPIVPRIVVYCSESARREHVERGYPADRAVVIANGFDLPRVDRRAAREELGRPLGLPPSRRLVGRAGRFHAQKDYQTFLRAAATVARTTGDVHFVACGSGVTAQNRQLEAWIDAEGLTGKIHLLGVVQNMPTFHAALDVEVSSSSFGEAHPGVVGEAMAVGTPVVATDVGDSALIVGETGRVVPPEDPRRLAAAVAEILRLNPDAHTRLGRQARARIAEHFGMDEMVRRYEHLYRELASDMGHQQTAVPPSA